MKEANFRIVFDIENEKTTVFYSVNEEPRWAFPIHTTKELLLDETALKSSIPSFIEGAIESYKLYTEKLDKDFIEGFGEQNPKGFLQDIRVESDPQKSSKDAIRIKPTPLTKDMLDDTIIVGGLTIKGAALTLIDSAYFLKQGPKTDKCIHQTVKASWKLDVDADAFCKIVCDECGAVMTKLIKTSEFKDRYCVSFLPDDFVVNFPTPLMPVSHTLYKIGFHEAD